MSFRQRRVFYNSSIGTFHPSPFAIVFDILCSRALHHSTFAKHFTTLLLPSTSPLYFCPALHHSIFAKHFTTLFLPSTSPLYFCQALHHSFFCHARHHPLSMHFITYLRSASHRSAFVFEGVGKRSLCLLTSAKAFSRKSLKEAPNISSW